MKTKLSKSTWLVLGGGVFLVLMAVLGMNYRSQVEAQARLNRQILQATQQSARIPVADLTAKEADLKAQLEKYDAELQAAKGDLTQSTDVIDVSGRLFRLARNSGVEIYEVRSSGITAPSGGKFPSIALPLALSVRGGVTEVRQFISSTTAEFSTSIVKLVDIKVSSGESGSPNSAALSTASITINFTSYKEK